MRVLVFVYLTFLYQLCEGAGKGKKTEDSKSTVKKADDSTKPAETTEVNTVTLDFLDIGKDVIKEQVLFVEYTDEEITYKSYTLRENVTAKSVKEEDATIWTTGDEGKRLKVLTYSKDNLHLCRINVFPLGNIPHCFEKVNEKWESLEHPEFSKKLNALLNPVNTKMRLEFMMLSDDVADIYEYYAHGMLVTIAFPKFKTTSVSCIGEIWKAGEGEECICARFYTRRGWFCTLYVKKGDGTEIKNFEYSNNKWNSVTNRNTLINTCISYTPSKDTETNVTTNIMDITKDDNTVYTTKTFTVSGINVKRQTPLPNKFINEVKDGETLIWKTPDAQRERCVSCELKSRGNTSVAILTLATTFDLSFLYFEKNGTEWKSIEKKADFDKKIEEMKKMETTQPTSIADLLSKVDSTLFNVEEAEEDNFKVLKLKAKDGVTITELTYGEETLWQAPNAGDLCTIATFYFGQDNNPVAASYRFKRDGKLIEGYRQFSGGKWLCLQDIDREG
ncbi:signal peptide containing protein [Theileria equi strain WA]|uniref:Signal peptide containing protein n=1 Tax=Theileria equi strain WA TaxID=1537102 RepID=L1LB09_THEEQ|nr:signal peptide containing protein [Theileria equi strain WA]EKX72465.1 signal peptide containing protein [Theileria equi strain WA]|eukprot:XP_004831917.1 signal peptide containing protein [Theileria equi strain WA]